MTRPDRAADPAGEVLPAGSPVRILPTLHALPRSVKLLLAGIAVSRMASFVAIFLILYLTHLGYSLSAAGAAVTAFGTGSIGGAWLGGVAADRFGSRRVITVSMLLSGAAAAVLAAGRSYLVLFLASLAYGVVTQCYRPAAAAMIADLTPPARLVVVTAASRLGLNVGATIAPLLGVWLVTYSYSLMFTVNAAGAAAFGLLAFVALPELGRRAPAGAVGAARGPAQTRRGRATARHGRHRRGPVARPWATMIADRRYLLVLAGMCAASLAEIQYQVTLPLQIHARALPTWLYGSVVALNGAIVICCELPLTRVVRRLPFRIAIAAGTFLIGAGIATFGISGQMWVFIAGAFIWTAGEMMSSPSLNSYPALIAPTWARGRFIAALTASQTAGYAAGPVLGTLLFQVAHPLVWFLCAGLGTAAFGCMLAGVRYGGTGRRGSRSSPVNAVPAGSPAVPQGAVSD